VIERMQNDEYRPGCSSPFGALAQLQLTDRPEEPSVGHWTILAASTP